MTNNLRKIRQDLCAYIKRCKDVHYSDSLLIIFLMSGIIFAGNNLFSAPADPVEAQKTEITNSIHSIRQQFRQARSENNKLLKATNLELTKLMEQGDHVTKSPWSSWQFGGNYFYNNWNGTYKGRGNKIRSGVFKREQSLNRYLAAPVDEDSINNTTGLSFIYEPNAAIPVSASITPKAITKSNPNIQKNVAIAGLPAFEPTVVMPPVTPQIDPPNPSLNIGLNLNSGSRGSSERINSFASNANAVMESVAVQGGDIEINRSGKESYSYTTSNDVKIVQISSGTVNHNAYPSPFSGYGTAANKTYVSTVYPMRFFKLMEMQISVLL